MKIGQPFTLISDFAICTMESLTLNHDNAEKCWSAKWLTQLDFGLPYSCFARKMADGRQLFLALQNEVEDCYPTLEMKIPMSLKGHSRQNKSLSSNRESLVLIPMLQTIYACVL